MYELNFIKYFTDEEKEKIKKYIDENLENLELEKGANLSVDISEAIGRTSNIDIYIE